MRLVELENWRSFHTTVGLRALLLKTNYRRSNSFSVSTRVLQSLESPSRFSGAPKINTNIDAAEISEPLLANLSDPTFPSGPPVAALSFTPASQRQPSSSTPPFLVSAALLSIGTSVHFTVVESPASIAAPHTVGSPPYLTPPSGPGITSVCSVVPLSLEPQAPPEISLLLPLLVPSDATTTTLVSLTRQLTTVKRQRDAASRELVPVTEELLEKRDKNDELRPFLAALRDAFQVLR